MTPPTWQYLHEFLEPLNVDLPARRQLKQYGTEPALQKIGLDKKLLDRLLRIFKFSIVRDVTAGLHRETKICRRLLAPRL